MPLPAGTRIGSYEIAEPIGAGGMGEVYRARDLKLNRDVALKVLPESFAADPERLSRFRKEAQVLASLNHPNIAHIHGFEDSGTLHALVMELVDGVTLAELIERKHVAPGETPPGGAPSSRGAVRPAGLPLSATLAIVRQLAEALEVAHEQGIVHRDLKPANVKVREDGVVKVLDFGIARVLGVDAGAGAEAMNAPTMSGHETQFGAILGTAAYMAPEQARGKPVDRRADIWAFGAVVYEMLTGERAFKGRHTSDILDAVLHQDVDWSKLPADTPPRVVKLLRRCLERDPKRRLRDIGEARIALEALGGPRRRGVADVAEPRERRASDVEARESDRSGLGTPPPAEPAARTPRWNWRPLLWDAGAVAAVGVVLLLARGYAQSRPIGARLESLEYAFLQLGLLSDSDSAASWQPNDSRLPIVVDISPLRTDKVRPTDRDKLEELIDTLEEMHAAAIGVDVDFSPDDSGNFVTGRDPQLFHKWSQYGNVRLGVFRREGDVPKRWLGRNEFRDLAAGIMLPQSEAGFALQYISPDLSRIDSKTPPPVEDYLLQMPAALYDAVHPGARQRLVENPRLGRSDLENRILLGKYPVDFSFLRHIEPIPYKEKGNLELWASKIQRRVVIIGDMNEAADTRCTQVRPEPVAGVLIHAMALATLNQGILRYVDDRRSLEYDLYLCLGALAVVWGFRRLAAGTAMPGLDAHAIDTLAFGTAACLVLVSGLVVIGFSRIFWPDPLWLAAALLAVPFVKDVRVVVIQAIRRVVSAVPSTGRTSHVS